MSQMYKQYDQPYANGDHESRGAVDLNEGTDLVYEASNLNIHNDSPLFLQFSQDDETATLDEKSKTTSDQTTYLNTEIKLGQRDLDESELAELEKQTAGDQNGVENQNVTQAKEIEQQKQNESEDENDENELPIERNDEWRSKSKHVFILSEAGKPIFSLHGNEVQLITFMGLLQALVSIIECDQDNKLRHVKAGGHTFVFLHKSHLILVCISSEPDKCVEQLEMELSYCYNQILSVVTLSFIEKIFSKHHNYDLRNKLSGTEKLLTNIVNRFKNDFSMLLNCVPSYPMLGETREQVSKIICQQITPIKYVIFGLLFFDNKLVSFIRPKTKNIHPVDVHLLVNVITGLDTPKTAEFTWYPICLPNFDSNGLMYAYISCLDESCRTCLILLTGLCDQEQSYELNECRKRIQQKLQAQNIIQNMNSKLKDNSLRLEQLGCAELKHFLFKDNKMFQYFVSDYALPYSMSQEQQQRIFDAYQRLYHKLHNRTNSLKMIFIQQKYETIVGSITKDFEMYATFSPLVNKEITIKALNRIFEFTQKNRTKIFLNAMPTIQR